MYKKKWQQPPLQDIIMVFFSVPLSKTTQRPLEITQGQEELSFGMNSWAKKKKKIGQPSKDNICQWSLNSNSNFIKFCPAVTLFPQDCMFFKNVSNSVIFKFLFYSSMSAGFILWKVFSSILMSEQAQKAAFQLHLISPLRQKSR